MKEELAAIMRRPHVKRLADELMRLTTQAFRPEHNTAILSWSKRDGVGRVMGFGHHLWTPSCSARPIIAVDVTQWMERVLHVGRKRNKENLPRRSTRSWIDDTHTCALGGETCFAVAAGLDPLKDVNWDEMKNGDGGIDFFAGSCHSVDVKTVNYFHDPYLKEFRKLDQPDLKQPFRAAMHVLAVPVPALDDRMIFLVMGHTDRGRLEAAPTRDWGHGPMHSLAWHELDIGLPRPFAGRFDQLLADEANRRGLVTDMPVTARSSFGDLWPGRRMPNSTAGFEDFLRSVTRTK